MEDNFHDSEHLPYKTLVNLIKKSDYPAIYRFFTMYFYIILSGIVLVYSYRMPIWFIIIAHIAFAIGFCSSFACEHETVHKTAFKSKILNLTAARLCSLIQLYPPTMFQELHFTHHRYTHIPGKDPEISFGGKPIPSTVSSVPMYIVWISGIPLFFVKFFILFGGLIGMPNFYRNSVFPFFRPRMRFLFFLESLFVIGVHSIFIFLAMYFNPGFWFIYSGLYIGHMFLAIYLITEHNGLPHTGNIMEKTRSMKTFPILKLIMWNMPYHAEHHAFPAVPFHALPELRKGLEEEIKHMESYPGFHLKVLTRKIK